MYRNKQKKNRSLLAWFLFLLCFSLTLASMRRLTRFGLYELDIDQRCGKCELPRRFRRIPFFRDHGAVDAVSHSRTARVFATARPRSSVCRRNFFCFIMICLFVRRRASSDAANASTAATMPMPACSCASMILLSSRSTRVYCSSAFTKCSVVLRPCRFRQFTQSRLV